MIRKIGRYTKDIWLGATQGLAAALAEPEAMCDSLDTSDSRKKLLSKYHDLAEFADTHYLFSPYHINNYDTFDNAYCVGAVAALIIDAVTIGTAHLIIGKPADTLAKHMVNKRVRIK